MTEEAFQEAIRSMRNNEGRLERAGDYWSDEDRERLRQMFNEGIGISEIALRLQRTESAVFQQIEKMSYFVRISAVPGKMLAGTAAVTVPTVRSINGYAHDI